MIHFLLQFMYLFKKKVSEKQLGLPEIQLNFQVMIKCQLKIFNYFNFSLDLYRKDIENFYKELVNMDY